MCLSVKLNLKTVGFIILNIILVNARPQDSTKEPPEVLQEVPNDKNEENTYIPYNFKYKVENPPTNTYFGHNENNNEGQNGATGSYYVLLADGRTMVVEYSVNGESGFVPRISYQKTVHTNATITPETGK